MSQLGKRKQQQVYTYSKKQKGRKMKSVPVRTHPTTTPLNASLCIQIVNSFILSETVSISLLQNATSLLALGADSLLWPDLRNSRLLKLDFSGQVKESVSVPFRPLSLQVYNNFLCI